MARPTEVASMAGRCRRARLLLLLAGGVLVFTSCAAYQTGPAGTTVQRVPGLRTAAPTSAPQQAVPGRPGNPSPVSP